MHRIVDEHRASCALIESATELRPVELKVVAKDVEERRSRIDVDLMDVAVDVDANLTRLPSSLGFARERSVARQIRHLNKGSCLLACTVNRLATDES